MSVEPLPGGDDIASLTYEQSRDALVQVVSELERGGAPLEQALALWERGEALAQHCQTWLDQARERIMAAGCFFPLTSRDELSRTLGTRHRAAIGLTEETDALVVVVSEETGTISVAFKGQLTRGLDEEKLRSNLRGVLCRTRPEERSRFRSLRRWLPAMNESAQTQEDGASFGKEEGGTRG